MVCCRWTACCLNSFYRNIAMPVMPDAFANLPPTAALPYAHPLDEFYARSGMALPKIERVAGEELPEPQRTLLVHQNDMTPTLENFHGGQIHLEILKRD